MSLMDETPTPQTASDVQGLTEHSVREMTDPQLCRKIAQRLGWKNVNYGTWWHEDHGDGPPPDYPNDLNAMSQVEEFIGPKQKPNYCKELRKITECANSNSDWKLLHATARQRAQAFVLTMSSQGSEVLTS